HRSEFVAPGEPAILRPLARVLVALTAVAALLALRDFDSTGASSHIESALLVLGVLLTFRALYLWLSPLAGKGEHTAEEGARARRLVRERGRDSLAYFSLRGDNQYLFSPSHRTIVAYRAVTGTALLIGDAIGHRRETPNGLMGFLIVEAIGWAREHHVAELSLNFAVFGRVLRADAGSPLRQRTARAFLLRFDRFFQLERLHSFNAKFFPEWRPRFVCIERWTEAPLVGFAYLHVQQLLMPPGPRVR